MKIYVCHSKKIDYLDGLYAPIRQSRLNDEHEFILPHEATMDARDSVSREIIKTCDLVIAEVSVSATGLGIELGWADAFHVPIICIHRSDAEPTGSLRVICDRFLSYDDPADLIAKLESSLTSDTYGKS